MQIQGNRKRRALTRVAGVGAALALVATAMTAAPAFAGGGSKAPATVTLSSSVPGVGLVTGEAVSFTATVTTSGAPATGSVVFSVVGSESTVATCDGGNTQPVSTSGGVTTATCSFAKGLLGKPLFYNVSAKLVDPNFTAPKATLVQTIDKSLTTTSLSAIPGSVIASEAFSFTATVQDVSPGTGSPTGSMEFAICPYTQPTCTGGPGGAFTMPNPTHAEQALNENKITFTLPSGVLTPGFYNVSADYVGDSNYWSSQSAFTNLLVTKVPTTLSLVASDNPTFNGGREILRAVIKGDSRATQSLGGPTGNVTFAITGASGDTLNCEETGTPVIPVGSKPANQGVARCSISGQVLTADSPYTISVTYSGDSVYNGSSGGGSLNVIDPP
jgi:large repetitive protein